MKPLTERVKFYVAGMPPRPTAEDVLLTLALALGAEDEALLEECRSVSAAGFAAHQAKIRELGEVRSILDAFVAVVQGRKLPEPKLPPLNPPPPI